MGEYKRVTTRLTCQGQLRESMAIQVDAIEAAWLVTGLQRRFGRTSLIPTMKFHRRGQGANGCPGRLYLPAQTDVHTVLHEFTHHLVGFIALPYERSHGPTFCRMLDRLLDESVDLWPRRLSASGNPGVGK